MYCDNSHKNNSYQIHKNFELPALYDGAKIYRTNKSYVLGKCYPLPLLHNTASPQDSVSTAGED
jgi:hypothetical protein